MRGFKEFCLQRNVGTKMLLFLIMSINVSEHVADDVCLIYDLMSRFAGGQTQLRQRDGLQVKVVLVRVSRVSAIPTSDPEPGEHQRCRRGDR